MSLTRTVRFLGRSVWAQVSMAIHRYHPDWTRVRALRAVPQWCNQRIDPGVDETEEWREWTHRPSTADQLRIESALVQLPLSDKRLLHVGVGNSELARRFSPLLKCIDGITIQPEEVEQGRFMQLSNYRVLRLNKFTPTLAAVLGGSYDYIVDNNPSAFACCLTHFLQMIDQYYALLSEGGMLLTDRLGLQFSVSGNHFGWRIDQASWQALGEAFGFQYIALTECVLGLRRRTHLGARIRQVVGRLV